MTNDPPEVGDPFDPLFQEYQYNSSNTHAWNTGTKFITFTAEGESSYAIHDVRVENVKPISNDEVNYYIDVAAGGCGSAGDKSIKAKFNLDSPGATSYSSNIASMSEEKITRTFPPTTVTKDAMLHVVNNISSCGGSKEFDLVVEYRKIWF